MNFLKKHLTKIGTTSTLTPQRLVSRPSRIPPNHMPRKNFGTLGKYVSPRTYAYCAGGAVIFGSGMILSYAKYNPNFRERLRSHSETTDDVIKFLWQEKREEIERKVSDESILKDVDVNKK